MPDFSLVPVDHQPDFSDFSLVPVDHDPFSADGAIQQAGAQPESQPQPLATGADLPGVGAPATNAQATVFDEPTIAWSRYNQPFGELKPATYTPTQQIGNFAADALIGLGMQPYTANDLASRVGNLLGLTPLGVVGSALDLVDAKRRDDFPGVVTAAAGMIPGAKGVARGVAADAIHLHHAWPKYLGGAVKQDLVPLPRSLHVEFHRGLDKDLPKWRGTAYYESRGLTERQEALQYLAAYTKDFDAEHGTKLYDALLKNGFPAP